MCILNLRHTKSEELSDQYELQCYYNDDPKCDYITPKVHIDHKINSKSLCKINSYKELAKMYMDLKNAFTKVFGCMYFPLFNYLNNHWHHIILTRVRMKPPKDIKYVFKCNSLLKLPRHMKRFIVIIYIQGNTSER